MDVMDTVRTAVDSGLGAIALLYAHRVGMVLDKHETRIVKLEKRRPRRSTGRR